MDTQQQDQQQPTKTTGLEIYHEPEYLILDEKFQFLEATPDQQTTNKERKLGSSKRAGNSDYCDGATESNLFNP